MAKSLCLLLAVAATAICGAASDRSFVIQNNMFLKDGQNFHVKAGEMHYARVPPEYWADRIQRLRSMGLNAIQTYVPWNWHEQEPGQYNFSGDRNITHFLQTAQDLGMVVVLRAGPYMCGEWEFGGFPAWLFQNGSIPLRTQAEPYMSFVSRWWGQVLLPTVKPYLYSNGGPIVMMQVENEYGSYGDVSTNPNDKAYMMSLINLAKSVLGPDLVLFTTDGGSLDYMTRGSIPGGVIYAVGDGCGDPQTCIDAQRTFNAPGQAPFWCSECYTGWLTHWGESGANTSSNAPQVDQILNLNGSVSLYMGHGGTNFGFWSGANGGGGTSYQPHETSYDYDSPVSEAGEHGYNSGVDKYVDMQKTLFRHLDGPAPPPEPALLPRTAYGVFYLNYTAPLLANINALTTITVPQKPNTPFFESFGCWYGFALYTSTISNNGTLTFDANSIRDRVHVFVDGVLQGIVYRVNPTSVSITIKAGGKGLLQLLVENMGRINFSHGMDDDRKGITGNVLLNNTPVHNWTTNCLPMTADLIERLPFRPTSTPASTPGFYMTTFEITDTPEDTFLYMKGWNKGIAWINGYNLGRYWMPQGPQLTLYVPAPRLQTGTNTLVVLELDGTSNDLSMQLVGEPMLQPPAPSMNCDPTMQPTAGARVAMNSLGPKLAHQQQWNVDTSGKYAQITLKAIPSLCLTVLPGCPHAQYGCMTVDVCTGSDYQLFTFKADPSEAGAHVLVNKNTQQCLDIYSHDAFEGSPLEQYDCYGAGEDNQRWSVDPTLGTIASYQASQTPGAAFVVTVCTATSLMD